MLFEQFINSKFFAGNKNYFKKTIDKYIFYTGYKFNLYNVKDLIISKNKCSDFIEYCIHYNF